MVKVKGLLNRKPRKGLTIFEADRDLFGESFGVNATL
jgi:hypothetical protein